MEQIMIQEVIMEKKSVSGLRWIVGMDKKDITREPINKYGMTVLIAAYNEEMSIADTIRSVQAQSVRPDEIIVIDDHSSDRTGEIAASLGVTVVRTNVNQGTKATALKYVMDLGLVKTELFITIDADTKLDPDCIKNSLPYFNDPTTAAVCGSIIPARIHTLWERGRFIEYMFGISLFKMAQNHIGAVMVASGCFTIFKTDLVMEMGGFNTRTMGEDMDLTWELSMKGYRIYCARDAYSYPYDPPTGKIFVAQIDRWYRSFFQNLAIHWKDLLRKDKKLATVAIGYLVDASLFMLVILFATLYSLYHLTFSSLLIAMAFDTAIVSMFAIIEGIRIKRLGQVLLSIPAYQITRTVTFYIFWRSMWKEWVIKDKLHVWVKGH
jgi:biofilm PGA synthesis N-glycosyltransferase PgaC